MQLPSCYYLYFTLLYLSNWWFNVTFILFIILSESLEQNYIVKIHFAFLPLETSYTLKLLEYGKLACPCRCIFKKLLTFWKKKFRINLNILKRMFHFPIPHYINLSIVKKIYDRVSL